MTDNIPVPAMAQVINVQPNPSSPGAVIVTVRCPFCGKNHQHGLPVGFTLNVEHSFAHCLNFDAELGRKGLRRKRRQQLEDGKALHERCGGGYHFHASTPSGSSQGGAKA